MLRIMVQGQALQLSDDITLNLVIENPLMLADKIPTPYTTTFDIPPTPANLRLLGYPNRVTSVNTFREYDSDVYYGAIRLLKGVLVVQQFDAVVKAYFRGVVLPDTISKQLQKIEMQRYDFGEGFWLDADFTSAVNFAYKYKQLILSALAGSEDFIAAPVKVADAEWPGAQDDSYFYNDNGIKAAQELYLNFFNARNQDYMMSDTGVVPPISSHTLIFPMPFLYRIFDTIFGDSLEDNIFRSNEFEKIVLLSSFHQAFVSYRTMIGYAGIITDADYNEGNTDLYFYMNSYMPAVAANDLFKDIFRIFCCTMFSVNGKFRILFNRDIITSYECESWTQKLIGSLASSKQAGQFYHYGYANSTYNGPQFFGTTLDTLKELSDVAATEDAASYLIASINQVISKAKRKKADPGDPDRYLYETVKADFGNGPDPETDADADTEEYDITSDTSPLPVNLEYYWFEEEFSTGIEFNTWAVPVWDGDRNRRPQSANILLYQGLSNTFQPGDKYPVVTPYNTDHFGNLLGALTLDWSGEYGLLNRFHKEFKAWIESDRVRATGTLRLSALDIKNLDLAKKKHIKGKLFFIEKLNVTIRKNSIDPAVIDFIEAPGGMPKTYISVRRADFARNNCGGGQSGSVVPFTKIYSSQISQADADAIATADEANFQTEGQAWANAKGLCQLSGDILLTATYTVIQNTSGYPRVRIVATLSGALPADIEVSYSADIYEYNNPGYNETVEGTFIISAGQVSATAYTDAADTIPNYAAVRTNGTITRVSPNPVGGATVRF